MLSADQISISAVAISALAFAVSIYSARSAHRSARAAEEMNKRKPPSIELHPGRMPEVDGWKSCMFSIYNMDAHRIDILGFKSKERRARLVWPHSVSSYDVTAGENLYAPDAADSAAKLDLKVTLQGNGYGSGGISSDFSHLDLYFKDVDASQIEVIWGWSDGSRKGA